MKTKTVIFAYLTVATICGNVFAVSPYATTIGQNLGHKSFLVPTAFPTTASDASFIERVQSKRDGYMPFFNRSAFTGLTVQEQDEFESMAYRAELQRRAALNGTSRVEYCANYPDDSANCPNISGTVDDDISSNAWDVPPDFTYPANPPSITQSTFLPELYMQQALTYENIEKYNLRTHNGGCTPSERSNHWKNIILTSGRYEQVAPAFEKFMVTAFRKEGGCVNDPDDRGGYTCYGCSSRGLCRGVDMKNVTRSLVEDLAYNNLYKKYNVDKLPDAFRGYALWGMWGSGAISGIKQFQGALGVTLTGKIDDATIYAAEHYTGDFAAAYTQNREHFLRNFAASSPNQKKFLRGWLNGLNLLQPSGCHVIPTNPIYR